MDIKSLLPFKIHSENFSRREKYINTTKRNVEISIQSLSDKIYINLSEKKISSNIITLLFSRTHSNERWQNSLSPSLDLLPRFIPPLFLRSEVWLGNTETRMEIAFLARRFVPSYREGGETEFIASLENLFESRVRIYRFVVLFLIHPRFLDLGIMTPRYG